MALAEVDQKCKGNITPFLFNKDKFVSRFVKHSTKRA